jgi:hypothetical protein
MRACPLLALLSILASSTALRSADPPPSLPEAVRKAVAERKLTDSDNLADRRGRDLHREIGGDGGVLVGLEVGLSKWFDTEIPYAVRPIYREGSREWTGAAAGSFKSTEVFRTVRATAKEGYAVGGLWIRSGPGLDRICLHYFRIKDGQLDANDNYASNWLGNSDGGSETYLDGGGKPVAGLLAETNRDQARGIGLVYARVSVPKPVTAVPPPTDAPAAVKVGEKSNLERESEAQQRAEDDEAGAFGVFLLAIAVLVVGALVAALVFFVRMQSSPPRKQEYSPHPRRPRSPDAETVSDATPTPPPQHPAKPLQERPGLASRLEPYLLSSPGGAMPGLAKSEMPPFFLVRSTGKARFHRMTRIYVLPEEILVIDAGAGSDMNVAAGVTAAAVVGGGLIGGLIGSAVGTMFAEDQKARGEAMQQKLDRLSLPALLEWSTEPGNFRANVKDLVGIRIDPPSSSFWRNRGREIGTLRFRHMKRGEYTFEFLCGVELRGAVELLRRAAGSSVRVGDGWDEATASYIRDL